MSRFKSTWLSDARRFKGRTGITQGMVLRELTKMGFSDIRKVVRWGETMVRMVDGEEAEAQALVPLSRPGADELY